MQNQSAATPRHHVLPTQDAPMSKQGLCRVLRSSSSVLRIGHLEQMRHPFVLREPSAHGPSMVGSHTKQQLTKKNTQFPLLFQWFSHTFPMVVPYFSSSYPYGFPKEGLLEAPSHELVKDRPQIRYMSPGFLGICAFFWGEGNIMYNCTYIYMYI